MEDYINNNCGFYKDLDENFNIACELAEKIFTHEELINMLSTGNIPQRQIAALKFDYVKDKKDVIALLSNLTGCDGKIREAVALKINTILTNTPEARALFADSSADIFADATIDINGNICRLVTESSCLLKSYANFSQKYTSKILEFTKEALDKLDKFIFKDKKYVINKQNFKLYWCLEALNNFYEYADNERLEHILAKCSEQNEYTIREKTAQVINTSNKFPQIREKLLQDENYYVRQMLNHPSLL